MPTLYLTPSALSDLSLLILVACVIGYLLVLMRRARQRGEKPVEMGLLAGASGGIAGFVLLAILEDTLYPDAGQLALPLKTVFLTAGLVCLLQFVYRFPACFPAERREARVAFWLSLLYPLGELGFAIYRYHMLAQGYIRYRDWGWTLSFFVLWLAFVVFRKVALADRRPVPYWRKLWRPFDNAQDGPADRTAQLARDFALLLGAMPLLIMGLSLLRDFKVISNSLGAALTSAGILLTVLLFVLLYLSSLPEQTSFLVKLVAVTLAGVLAIAGALGYLLTPPFIRGYHNPNTDLEGKTLRFTPNERGGYTVAWAPYQFDPSLPLHSVQGFDSELALNKVKGQAPAVDESLPYEYNHAAIGFDFPFFGQTWSDFYVMRNSYVAFGRDVRLQASLFQYGGYPAIFVLGLDLILPPDNEEGGVYVHRAPDKTTVTWLNLPESANEAHRHTMQLALYPDGTFEMSYVDLDEISPFDVLRPWQSFRLIGALPGEGNTALAYFQLTRDLPFEGGPGGAAQGYHLEFRRALHELLAPLFLLALLSSAVVVLGLPPSSFATPWCGRWSVCWPGCSRWTRGIWTYPSRCNRRTSSGFWPNLSTRWWQSYTGW